MICVCFFSVSWWNLWNLLSKVPELGRCQPDSHTPNQCFPRPLVKLKSANSRQIYMDQFVCIPVHMVVSLRKPASWLVAVCERSENRGCGGGGCRKGTKSRRAPVLSARKRSILLDYVPLGNLLTVGYRFPLGPPFWWPERPWGCIGKYNETAGKHDNDQRKSYKIPWKTDENGANARNKPWKIPWKMEETGANARRKPWRYSKHARKMQRKCRKMW